MTRNTANKRATKSKQKHPASASHTLEPGFSWFQVDRHGRYRAWTLARKPGATCLSYDPNGWTGQLYPIGPDLHTVESNTFYRTKPIPPSRLLAHFRHLRCPETTP